MKRKTEKLRLPRIIRYDEITNVLGFPNAIKEKHMIYNVSFTVEPLKMKSLSCGNCQLFVDEECTRPRKSNMTKNKKKKAKDTACSYVIPKSKKNYGWWKKVRKT